MEVAAALEDCMELEVCSSASGEGSNAEEDAKRAAWRHLKEVPAVLATVLAKRSAAVLLCLPVAWLQSLSGDGASVLLVFWTNFGAVLALGWVFGEILEQLQHSARASARLVLSSTIGNFLVVALMVQAARAGLFRLLHDLIIGALLLHLLFVTGCCFAADRAYRRHQAEFNPRSVLYQLGPLGIATLVLLMPTGLARGEEWAGPGTRLALSALAAVLLSLVFVQWLVLNLLRQRSGSAQPRRDHRQVNLLEEAAPASMPEPAAALAPEMAWGLPRLEREAVRASIPASASALLREMASRLRRSDPRGEVPSQEASEAEGAQASSRQDDVGEPEEPQRHPVFAMALLALCAALLTPLHCGALVRSVGRLADQLQIPEALLATVFLPIAGCFPGEMAALTAACKGTVDIGVGTAIRSATHVITVAVPVAFFASLLTSRGFELKFMALQTWLLIGSEALVVLCFYVRRKNWLKGVGLITAYLLAVIFFCFHGGGGTPPD